LSGLLIHIIFMYPQGLNLLHAEAKQSLSIFIILNSLIKIHLMKILNLFTEASIRRVSWTICIELVPSSFFKDKL
jgi:hypothetical protein